MTPKLQPDERVKLIERALAGEPVARICKEAGISRVLFYRWLKRYREKGQVGLDALAAGRPRKSHVPKHIEFEVLSPIAREKMVSEVVNGTKATDVAQKYGVSRVTLYKWLKRYNQAPGEEKEEAFQSKEPQITRYWRQTPEKYEEAILSLVAKHPEFGLRKILVNLPKVGETPIVGHHAIQNILRRHNLNTYEQRLAYAQSQITPVTRSIDKAIAAVAAFFAIPQEARNRIIRFGGIAALSAFITVVVFGLGSIIAGSFAAVPTPFSLGLIFAWIALAAGSIFFLYSLKYYITLAIVLSYSQKEEGTEVSPPNGLRGFISYLLGQAREIAVKAKKPVGLEPNLEHIKLEKHPYVSVQIPFYNEKNVVERSIVAATSFDYPEYEVIVCDDSTDETTAIVQEYLRNNKKGSVKKTQGEGWELTVAEVKDGVTLKHLHRTSRSGFKGGALGLALKLVDPRTEFVTVFDADFVPYPDTLALFLKYFKAQNEMSEDYAHSDVAAVQGYQWHVLNKSENWITRGVRSEYAGSYVIERSGEEIYGGLKQISGAVYMIRKDILREIGWGVSITEDFELTLKLYNAGYKVVYTPYIQAPAECVSTIKRLIRQRMRWAEGHSQNVRRMFLSLAFNPRLTFSEKMEFMYLSPYYLQAFFFLVGTLSWLLAEAIFTAKLPFWTSLWGWSLVLTNMLSLPLMNAVGLFLEESEERDYLGLASFTALSYLLVPFQAYASLKGFLESTEGPWFRTPKTGKITDIFTRGKFYRFIAGILPGTNPSGQVAMAESVGYSQMVSPYLALASANSRFDSFAIPRAKRFGWVAKVTLSILLSITTTLLYFARNVQIVQATNITGPLKLDIGTDGQGGTWPAFGNYLNNTATYNTTGTRLPFRPNNANSGTNNYMWFTRILPTNTNNGVIPGGNYYLQIAKSGNSTANNTIAFRVQLLLTNNNGTNRSQIMGNMFQIRTNNADNTLFQYYIGNYAGTNISSSLPRRLSLRIMYNNASNARMNINWAIDNSTVASKLVIPAAIQVPEIPKVVVFVILVGIMPAIPGVAAKLTRGRKNRRDRDRGGGWGEWFDQFFENVTGRREVALDNLPV